MNLLDLDRGAMEAYFFDLGAKPYHGRNVLKWIHKHGVSEFEAMTDLAKKLRARLAVEAEVRIPELVVEQVSWDGTTKWVLALADGQRIETVLIPDGRRSTVCVSSQVGCALDCAFCSTAQQGFNRNLTVGEIIGQVWHATRELGHPPTNIVMMGMGEPLANFDAVVKAMNIMQDDLTYMLAKSRVTLSTAGIVPNIYRLREESDVSLAVSLHAPENDLRDELVPINRKYPLQELIPACRDFIRNDKRRKITWEYVMLDGVNDSDHHAKALLRLLDGVPSKLNLIPFNPFPGSVYATSATERIEAFRQRLLRGGIMAIKRKPRGQEIDAACGQLVGRVRDKSQRQLRHNRMENNRC